MSACEKRDLTMSSDVKFVEFESTSYTTKENSTDIVKIPVYLATTDKGLKTTVTFEFKGIGDNPAVEGEDYTIIDADKEFVLNGTTIYDTLRVQMIDNGVIDKDKKFQIEIMSSTNGVSVAQGRPSVVFSIIDDEHPLAWLFGTYNVSANSLYNGPTGWSSSIVAVPNKVDEVDIIDLWDSGVNPIRVKVDETNTVLTLVAGQVLFTHSTYGDAIVLDIASGDPSVNIVGAVNEDGTLSFDGWSITVSAGDFDAFATTTWSK